MRNINKVIIHASATKPNQKVNADIIRNWHKSKGWLDIGYHFVILPDGTIEIGRPIEKAGAHVKGHNFDSIGICLIGGLNLKGKPENNFTENQFNSLGLLVDGFKWQFNISEIKGHRDYSPDKNKDGKITKNEWVKVCPCFDVGEWYESRTKEINTGKSKMEKQAKDGMVKLFTDVDSNSNDNNKNLNSSRKRKSRRSSSNSTNG